MCACWTVQVSSLNELFWFSTKERKPVGAWVSRSKRRRYAIGARSGWPTGCGREGFAHAGQRRRSPAPCARVGPVGFGRWPVESIRIRPLSLSLFSLLSLSLSLTHTHTCLAFVAASLNDTYTTRRRSRLFVFDTHTPNFRGFKVRNIDHGRHGPSM